MSAKVTTRTLPTLLLAALVAPLMMACQKEEPTSSMPAGSAPPASSTQSAPPASKPAPPPATPSAPQAVEPSSPPPAAPATGSEPAK